MRSKRRPLAFPQFARASKHRFLLIFRRRRRLLLLLLSQVPADELALRQEHGDRDLAELREVKQFTIPVFVMSPGVRPGDPVSLNLFEPRYREMAR